MPTNLNKTNLHLVLRAAGFDLTLHDAHIILSCVKLLETKGAGVNLNDIQDVLSDITDGPSLWNSSEFSSTTIS